MTELHTWNGQPGLGPLAAALAKAQSEFGAVTKDKTVTVQKKTGGSYSFKYAPLDQILSVVKGPLSKNGLALVQLLDMDSLVTMLIHDSGASLEARTPLPSTVDVQAYGSAITYLRRYAVQAMLGIAAEDDDDGNRAAGNLAVPAQAGASGGLIGTAEVGKATDLSTSFQLVQSPHPVTGEDGWALGFKLKSNGGGFKVLTRDELALQLLDVKDEVVGKRVTVFGRVRDEEYTPKGTGRKVVYQVIDAERIKTEAGTLPVMPLREEADTNTSGSHQDWDGTEPAPLRDPEQDVIPVAEGQVGFDLVESARLDAEEAARTA